jgi:O-antigen biosynthesis protein
VPDDELTRARDELTAARTRILDLEGQLAEILSSPTWRLALRLRAWKGRLAGTGPLGRFLLRLIRLAQIALHEGPRGLRERVRRRLRGIRAPARLVEPLAVLPATLPPMTIPAADPAAGPVVSIVIPVFNQAPLTYQCLDALLARTPAGRYEVIVVDNASTDATPRLLAHVEGLRVARNEMNRGFVEACNQGAKEAGGDLLLFLNNDTVVLEGWLPPLLETAGDPTVGAVGARLLYPDGRLQEAGSIIWRDGTGWNYGRGEDADLPAYQHRREVDYCSGACLLVRRELFEQLGGFDLRYAPAYYEDADLCFELRRLGFRVVYEPRARVVHLEGATAGTDVGSGVKRFQEVNRAKFVEKHAAALGAQHPPDPARVIRARDRRPGRRILIIDHMVPLYDQDAGSVRMLALLSILGGLGHAVTFLPDNLAAFEPYTDTLRRMGVETIVGPVDVAAYLDRHLGTFDLVIVCRATIAIKHIPAIAARPGHPPVVFDTIDLHYLRERRRAELEGDPDLARAAETSRQTELYLAGASDMVWVTSPHEAAVLRGENPALRVEVVPLVHDVRAGGPDFAARRDLMFIGGFRHPPNADAVLHFLRDIFPLVKRELPDARFVVVGTHVPPGVQALASEDVLIEGYVRDVEPVFDRSRVFVAPIRYGAGLKGKITHSLASGLPVVTTPAGAEGLDLVDREHALIAADAPAFAARTVELYRDEALWTRLAERGRRHVDARFGRQAVAARLDAILRALWAGAETPRP